MPAKIIKFGEDQDVVCPICKTLIVDAEEGLTEQPSCAHVRFVYANGEAFEHDAEGLEERLNSAQEKADEEGDYFDEWDWLLAQCGERDVILEHNSEEMACGPVSFKVWIGIRSRQITITDRNEFSSRDHRVFFRPTPVFVRWLKTNHSDQHIFDVGAGVGCLAKSLAESGLNVTALDLQPRIDSEFSVIQGDSTTYQFEKDSVLMICRPCHDNGFVRKTILRALNCGARTVVYVGLQRNVRADLGGYYKQFTKRRIGGIGHADERVWEMKVSRLQANANLRRGTIPPLCAS